MKTINVQGVASFPRLNEPDTKYDPAGVFNTKLILTTEAALPLIARFDALRDDAIAKAEEQSKGKKAQVNDHPLNPEYDEEGNETGQYILSCKMKASGVSKKTNKPWSRKLPIFDSQGAASNAQVTSGAVINCAIEPISYAMAGKEKGKPVVNCGVSLRLEAVQIIQLGGGNQTASGFGFGATEGGYVDPKDAAPEEGDDVEAEASEQYDF
jgi:hypothetical protein